MFRPRNRVALPMLLLRCQVQSKAISKVIVNGWCFVVIDAFGRIESVELDLSHDESEILRFLRKWQRDGVAQVAVGQLMAVIRGSKSDAKAALRGLSDCGLIFKRCPKTGGGLIRITIPELVPRPVVKPKKVSLRFPITVPTRCIEKIPARFAVREEVFKKTDGKCFYCGGTAETMDHMQPSSRGGTNEISNLIGACHRCNSEKGNATVAEYLEFLNFRGVNGNMEALSPAPL